MAARRLIIVLVLLLAASIVAATLAPDRTGRLVGVTDTTTTEQTTTETTISEQETTTAPEPEPTPEPTGPAVGGSGEALSARIDASVKHPETVHGLVGDQLALAVGSEPPRLIAIPSLGLTEFAGEDAPAQFNLLLRAPGAYAITDGEDPNVILGRLKVGDRGAGDSAKARGEGKPQRQDAGG